MATPRDIIRLAMLDLGSIAPGDTFDGTSEEGFAFTELNQMVGSWSTEKDTIFQFQTTSASLFPGTLDYNVGPGGTFNTGARPEKILCWRARNGAFGSNGICLTIPEVTAQSQLNPLGSSTALPQIIGADTNFPLLNLRVWPPPSNTPAIVDIYFTLPIQQFGTITDTINMPPGYEAALASNLAVRLYPQYAKQGGIDPALAAKAQNDKAAIVGVTQSLMQAAQTAAGVQQ